MLTFCPFVSNKLLHTKAAHKISLREILFFKQLHFLPTAGNEPRGFFHSRNSTSYACIHKTQDLWITDMECLVVIQQSGVRISCMILTSNSLSASPNLGTFSVIVRNEKNVAVSTRQCVLNNGQSPLEMFCSIFKILP